MTIQDDNFHVGHRERLKSKFLDNKLMDYELLELLLSFAIPRRDVRPLARKLIQHFGGVYYVIAAEYDALIAVPGVGRSTAILIRLVCEMMKISHIKTLEGGTIFYNLKALQEYCRLELAGKTYEEVHILYFDSNFKLIDHETHSRGSIDSSNIHIDKILQKALNKGVRTIVMVHNHPASDNMFSSQDVAITQALVNLLGSCGITVFDHYVIVSGILYSMREKGLLNESFFNKEQFFDFTNRT